MKIHQSTFKSNGSSITRVSSSKISIYIPNEVPVEVIELWLARLAESLPMPLRLSRLRYIHRRKARRKLTPIDRLKRRCIRRRRPRVPVRHWRRQPAR
jgi:hypothetical protein